MCKCVYSIYSYTVWKLQNLDCTCTPSFLLDMYIAIFPKKQYWFYLIQNSIELNGKFLLSNIKFVVNQFNYPLFYKLLQFLLTIHAESVECERSISALSRIYNYSRTTLRLNWLGNISLLFIKSELMESIDMSLITFRH